MSKFFMYSSELQEIEKLMMLVPNFLPRRSGVIVVQRFRSEEDQQGLKVAMGSSLSIVEQTYPVESQIKFLVESLIMKRLSVVVSRNANFII